MPWQCQNDRLSTCWHDRPPSSPFLISTPSCFVNRNHDVFGGSANKIHDFFGGAPIAVDDFFGHAPSATESQCSRCGNALQVWDLGRSDLGEAFWFLFRMLNRWETLSGFRSSLLVVVATRCFGHVVKCLTVDVECHTAHRWQVLSGWDSQCGSL